MSKEIAELELSNTPEELREMTTKDIRILWNAARNEITERRRHGNTPELRRAMRDMGACRAELNRRESRAFSGAPARWQDTRPADPDMLTPGLAARRKHQKSSGAREWSGAHV